MNETLLDYAINPTPYPIQASPSTGNPNLASLTLVVSNSKRHIITCSGIALTLPTGANAKDFCSDATGIFSTLPTGWSVKQQGGLFTFTPDTNDKGQVGKDGLVFGLSGIKVNQEPGSFQITIAEEASDPDASPPAPDQPRSRSWQLTKFPSQFTVGDLNADPFIVGSGGSTTLSWSGSGSSGNYTALYEIQYADADGNKVTIDHPKGETDQPLPPIGGYTVDGLKATTTFYLLVTVQIQGSNNPLEFTRERTVTVTAPHPPKPLVTSYTGELQPDGSLLLKWTTQPDHDVTVTLKPAISPMDFQGTGQFSVQKPPLPLLNNDLYALTATLGEKSDRRVFTTCQKFGVLRPAIGVGGQPASVAVAPDGGHVFVTNSADNNVSVIEVNLNNNPPFQVLSTRVGTRSGANGIAVSPTNSKFGKYVFVANQLDNSVTVFAGTPPFQIVSAAVLAGNVPGCLAVSPDGRCVFVPINLFSGIAVSVIDTASAPSFTVVQGPDFPGVSMTGISGLAVSLDGNYLFASDVQNDSLWALQVEAGANPPYRVLSPALGVGKSPWGIAVSPDGHYVFTVNLIGNSVSVVDVSNGPPFRVLSSPVAAGSSPWGLTVSPDGRFLFVSNANNGVSVLVIDENSHPPVQPLQTLSVGTNPGGIAASPDGRFIFVANNGDNTVSVIEAAAVSM